MTDHIPCPGDFAQFDPPGFLKPYIDHFWYHTTRIHHDMPGCFYRRVIPGAHVCIAFARKRDLFGRPEPGTLYFFGPLKSWRFVKIDTGQELAAVCLRLEWCEPILGISPAEHFDSYYPMRTIAGPAAERLEDMLQGTVTLDQVFLTLTTYFNEQIRNRISADMRRPLSVFASMRENKGALPPSWIAYQHDLSEHFLHDFVANHSGLTPETFSRFVRLRHAISACENLSRPDWQRIVNDHGFADYDTMLREIRAMTGAPPYAQQHRRWGPLGFPTVPPDSPTLTPEPAR